MNFFDPNIKLYPNMEPVLKHILDVTLEQGDCLYVPELYYYQSRTVHDETTMILLHYESSSKLTNLLNIGIEQNGLLDTE